MLSAHDRVIVGVSGGADSVCLLFVLLEWAKETPLELAVVHVNHGIRKEASGDAAYVEALCGERGIPFYLTEVDVRRLATVEKCSEEEAGRKVRYEAFSKAAVAFDAQKIAVAHNSNDRSETMLFHLFRGSGLKGLGSIQPIRGEIIRPILNLERREIESYLMAQKIPFCQDATNDGDDYTRNRIRHHILPYVEEHIVKGCVSHMAQTADMLLETEDYLAQQTDAAMKECIIRGTDGVCCIPIHQLLQHHPVLQKRILFALVKNLSPCRKDISYVHIAKLLDLFQTEGNRSVDLPFGIWAKREYTKVFVGIVEGRGFLSKKEMSEDPNLSEAFQSVEVSLEYAGCMAVDDDGRNEPFHLGTYPLGGGESLAFSIILSKNIQEPPQNQYTKWFDYDKIEGCIVVRTRAKGDYLTIADGTGGMRHKSIKDFMIDRKIPPSRRDSIPILAEGNHVLWLIGYRISEYYKISGNTERILQVQLVRTEGSESGTEEKNVRTR